METKTHWKKLTNPNYIGAWDFEPGQELTVTIKEIKQERVKNQDGKEENCTVAYFVESKTGKGLILNKTNMKMIQKVYGTPYIQDWVGKKITLSVAKVKAFGDVVDAIRVKNKQP